jgi:acid phosphatase class B
MVLKAVTAQVEKTWTTTKKILAAMSVWGLIFSLVTVARLGVAFNYDGTLVNSVAAFQRAAHSAQLARSPEYWNVVNTSYELESPKPLPYALAWAFRVLGFKIMILADRQSIGGDGLRKEWRHLAPRGFVFTIDPASKHLHLQDGRYVLFFGGSDRDILEARKAGVYPVRVKRGRGMRAAGTAEDYHPGFMGEIVLPFSEFSA